MALTASRVSGSENDEKAGVVELADVLDSKSGATLGNARPIDVLLTLSATGLARFTGSLRIRI
jgi:hypothetical protein